MHRFRLAALVSFVLALGCAGGAPLGLSEPGASENPELRFRAADGRTRSLALDALLAGCELETIEVADPYYERPMRFLACPLAPILERGFDRSRTSLSTEHFFLNALDGYARPAEGSQLLGEGGWLAFADAELVSSRLSLEAAGPSFAPLGLEQIDPAPFYVIWSGSGQNDPHHWPWPYQLAEVRIEAFQARYPRTEPAGEPRDSAAWRGYSIFRRQCVMCHAINGDGGAVGPELNVPKSIVDYRTPEQIRAYVRNPEIFRFSRMPKHPGLTDRDLENLLDYFRAMSVRKIDPRTGQAMNP